MSIKLWNYTTPEDYTYDGYKIEVSNGSAHIRQYPFLVSDVYSCYHLNETSGTTAVDTANGRNGTLVNNPTWASAKLNNGLTFVSTGSEQYVDFGNIASFERTNPFSFELWFNTSQTTPSMLVCKQDTSTSSGYSCYLNTGALQIRLINNWTNNKIIKSGSIAYNDKVWHHLVVTYDGSSTADGILAYVDGTNISLSTVNDNLSATIVNTSSLLLAARGEHNYKFSGKIDEFIIYNRVITQSEVTYRYNSGTGKEDLYQYNTSKPYIQPSTLFHSDYVAFNNNFLETLGSGTTGSVKYTLSNDGYVWKYFNGYDWVSGGDSTNCILASVIDSNFSTFPLSNNFTFRAYLISDGYQPVILDDNTFNYTANQVPSVYAGEDKSCKDNDKICPFSDAIISDPDGNIENANAHYYIEGSGWIEIVKGTGTLQDAIRAVEYTFDNPGDITCQLRVQDEIGSNTTNSMIVTVSQYTVSFTLKDADGWQLPNITVNFGDGNDFQLKTSPFTYSFDYGSYNVSIEKSGYYPIHIILDPMTTPVINQVMTFIGTVNIEDLVNAVWDANATDHTTAGTMGKTINKIDQTTGDNQALILSK